MIPQADEGLHSHFRGEIQGRRSIGSEAIVRERDGTSGVEAVGGASIVPPGVNRRVL